MLLFLGALLAPAGAAPQAGSPRTAEQELATFSVPDGFEVELVAADPELSKVVDIAFDDSGRMWAVTAVEYPLDANETPGAEERYARGGRDRVLVLDTPCAPGRQSLRAFAEGMFMPMAVLPIAGGVLIGQGPEILFLQDRDGDGRADAREVVLDGFGVQDSHLMPHRFVRGPGEWIYCAQGAFNSSRVRTKSGAIVPFDQCKVGRFKLDGSRFEVVGTGLNNIWGFVLDRRGEMWVQEANDLYYSLVPFYVGASYPGIGDHRAHPYSPWQPALADFLMGGTGLSGLALCEDPGGFPPPYDAVFFVANPIARSLQAIRATREGETHRLAKLPDFLTSSDEWFRPVAVHFGPDGCLYVVDWYNEIISHNEVPRDHPGRDRTRGRIWRIRAVASAPRAIPDVARASATELLAHLQSDSTWEARAAWHQIVDRRAAELGKELQRLACDRARPVHVRLLALWSLEGLGTGIHRPDDRDRALLADPDPDVRREAVRALGEFVLDEPGSAMAALAPLAADPDRGVRVALVGALARMPGEVCVPLLVAMIRPALPPAPANETIAERELRVAHEFERSLVRAALERHPGEVEAFLDAPEARFSRADGRALAALSLPPERGAARLAALLTELGRAPDVEELALLVRSASDPEVGARLAALFARGELQIELCEALLEARPRLADLDLGPRLAPTARDLARREQDPRARSAVVRLVSAYRIRELEPELAAFARAATDAPERIAAVRALLEIGARDAALFAELARSAPSGGELQRLCVEGLAGARDPSAVSAVVELWASLPEPLQRRALRRLAGTSDCAAALAAAFAEEALDPHDLDGETLERLRAALPGDERLARLERDLAGLSRPVLALYGGDEDWVDSDIDLEGAFTVECWIALEEPLTNADGILGRPGGADFNFADGKLRLYGGPELRDLIVASKPLAPGTWSHVAVTRSAAGELALYLDGERDPARGTPCTEPFLDLDIGRTTPGEGTRAELAEFRVWSVERTAREIGDDFQRSLEGLPRPRELAYYAAGAGPWGTLRGAARVVREPRAPRLLDAQAAQTFAAKLDRFRSLASEPGDAARGRDVFARACASCHTVAGAGTNVGPNLDGAGLKGTDALLRALLSPSAAIESGYRLLRVETTEGELLEGMLASQDETAIVLRRQDREDLRLARSDLRRARFERLSVMPEGLLESLSADEARDLLTYLSSLR